MVGYATAQHTQQRTAKESQGKVSPGGGMDGLGAASEGKGIATRRPEGLGLETQRHSIDMS